MTRGFKGTLRALAAPISSPYRHPHEVLEADTASPIPEPQAEVGGHLTFLQHERLSQRGDGPEGITIQAAQALYRDGGRLAEIDEQDHSPGIHPVHYPAPGQREGGTEGCSPWRQAKWSFPKRSEVKAN